MKELRNDVDLVQDAISGNEYVLAAFQEIVHELMRVNHAAIMSGSCARIGCYSRIVSRTCERGHKEGVVIAAE